jgi:hypothetical protein
MKMEQTECSETSAYKIQTPGNYPEENKRHRCCVATDEVAHPVVLSPAHPVVLSPAAHPVVLSPAHPRVKKLPVLLIMNT